MSSSYLNILNSGLVEEKINSIKRHYTDKCMLCPIKCKAKRINGEIGFCGVSGEIILGSWNIHKGEEPPISGNNGSGTVFFSGCSMKCIFCQNYPISQLINGKKYSISELSEVFLKLQKKGVHNLNFVTPTQYTYHIIEALFKAVEKGLTIPIVWNSSGYENVEVIKLLNGIVDIYLPDLKCISPENSFYFSKRKDYYDNSIKVIKEMYSQVGNLKIDESGVAMQGILVRHLVLPDNISDSLEVIDKLKEISPELFISVMSQYFPAHLALDDNKLKRRIYSQEYDRILNYIIEKNYDNVFIQEM